MIGYILMGIGAWLVYDDIKAKKTKGGQDGILQTGNDRDRGSYSGKSGESNNKPDRNGRVSPIPVKPNPKGVQNDVRKKSVHKVEFDQDRNRAGNDCAGQSDTTSGSDQGKSVNKPEKGGQDQNARVKVDNENDACNNGDHVRPESVSGDESDGAETD